MPNHDRVSIGRRNTSEGERVVFIKGTKILAEAPIEVIREAANTITKFGVYGDPKVAISFSVANGFEVSVYKWWGGGVKVSISEYPSPHPMKSWDLIEVDPF